MSIALLAAAGSLPILVTLGLMAGLRWPAVRAMAVGWVLASLLGLFLWGMAPLWWAASALYGVLQSVEIIVIVLGAIVLMNHLEGGGAMLTIRRHLGDMVQDGRVQLLLIGLGFMTLIEGVAGFGTPGALGAPLLLGLGFTPTAAAVFGLLFNAGKPPLGAAGVPVNGGIGSVIDATILPATLPPAEFLHQVAGWTGFFTGGTLAILGLFSVFLLLYWFGTSHERTPSGAWRGTREVAALALFLGALTGAVQLAVAWAMGPELADTVAGFVTLAVGLFMARRGILMPARVWTFPSAHPSTPGEIAVHPAVAESPSGEAMSVARAWIPYILVTVILLITRWPGLGMREALQHWTLGWERVLGQEIAYTLRPLWVPGIVPFIPVALFTAWLHRMDRRAIAAAWKKTGRQTLGIAMTLGVAVSMAQVMIRSAVNAQGLPGMMEALSTALAQAAGPALPLLSPWLGSLGAFMTGSSTSSNILFSVLQHNAAADLGLSRTLAVALQNAGSGVGNVISVLNITAVCGVIGLHNAEGTLLRRLLVPALILTLLTGIAGLLLAPLTQGLY